MASVNSTTKKPKKRYKTVQKNCAQCNGIFFVERGRQSEQKKFCSRACYVNSQSLETRFHSKIIKTASCWLWAGTVSQYGYGLLSVEGKNMFAHRFSYQYHNGIDPADKFVCHTCDNRRCVNPTHLFLGTSQDNHRDMVQKKRNARGEMQGQSKLTENQVREIRRLSEQSMDSVQLSKMFGVDKRTIRRVTRRESWTHVE